MSTLSIGGLRNGWQWWQTLSQNPIYLREKGRWGKPNPFYETLRRYSPFVVMGAILIGLCAGATNTSFFTEVEEATFVIWCLLCLPGVLLSMITIFGAMMAPALTAPTISLERNRGTWDLLRLTPQSTASILLAKLLGSLARLRIWRALFWLSLFQGFIIAGVLPLVSGQPAVSGLAVGMMVFLRPWLEIFFAAMMGLFLSVIIRSAQVALALSYTAVVFLKLFNSSSAWMLLSESFLPTNSNIIVNGIVGPTAVYAVSSGLLWLGIVWQTAKWSLA